MARNLVGKVCAITGGATGIGRAISIEFVRQGAQVVVNHLGDGDSQTHVASLREEIAAATSQPVQDVFREFAGDMASAYVAGSFIEYAIGEFGHVDVLVANAGIARFHEFLSTPDDWIQEHLQVNVGGAYYVTREAGRAMKAQGRGGSIIGISSISAHTGSAELVHYTVTKAAVCNLMQSAAVALGPSGIRCNALLPGTIETRLNKADLAVEAKRKAATDRTALKRLGQPSDMAGPAVFLASDLSSYVTGAQLLVDGGSFVNFQ